MRQGPSDLHVGAAPGLIERTHRQPQVTERELNLVIRQQDDGSDLKGNRLVTAHKDMFILQKHRILHIWQLSHYIYHLISLKLQTSNKTKRWILFAPNSNVQAVAAEQPRVKSDLYFPCEYVQPMYESLCHGMHPASVHGVVLFLRKQERGDECVA